MISCNTFSTIKPLQNTIQYKLYQMAKGWRMESRIAFRFTLLPTTLAAWPSSEEFRFSSSESNPSASIASLPPKKHSSANWSLQTATNHPTSIGHSHCLNIPSKKRSLVCLVSRFLFSISFHFHCCVQPPICRASSTDPRPSARPRIQ